MIGGFRSDLSITRKPVGNFGNVSAGVLFSKVAYQRKRWKSGFRYFVALFRNNSPELDVMFVLLQIFDSAIYKQDRF